MTYAIKSVKYKNAPRKILLQNENGPCPLLAAANALLIQGLISLPASAVRNNVASIDDVSNMLAERALKGVPPVGSPILPDTTTPDTHQYHIDEMLQLFPTLQYGMDVNPKFNCGPTGVEYTIGVNAFDLMNVDLVHGWLVDDNEDDIRAVVGTKTYNELTEVLINGNEAREQIPKLTSKMEELKVQISELTVEISKLEGGDKNDDGDGKGNTDNMEESQPPASETEATEGQTEKNTSGIDVVDNDMKQMTLNADDRDYDEDGKEDKDKELQSLQQALVETKQEFDMQSKIASDSAVVDDFLQSTSHQLTYTGLTELHNHIKEEKMCVFFRNNHFATMTKNDGHLYLLVTDLGYANVPDVLWEKLDDISGDTEYADHQFVQTKPRLNVSAASGPRLSPEQMLAQRNGAERDYQLALELSRNENAIEEQEGKLIAAATAASLQEFSNNGDTTGQDADANGDRTQAEEVAGKHTPHQEEQDRMVAMQLQAQSDSGQGNHSSHHQEEQDRMVAMQLQAQFREDATVRQNQMRRNSSRSQEQHQFSPGSRRKKDDNGCLIC